MPMLRPDVFGGLATHSGDALSVTAVVPEKASIVDIFVEGPEPWVFGAPLAVATLPHALGSRLVNVGDLGRPMDALPLFVFVNARQPNDALNQQAWGAALLLLAMVLVINVAVRARSWGRQIG